MPDATFTRAGQWGPEGLIDAAGDAQVGVAVALYQTDGSTLAARYTDATKATPAANPWTSDAQGNVTLFADPGQYVLKVTVGGLVTPLSIEVPVDPTEAALDADVALTNAALAVEAGDRAAADAAHAAATSAVHGVASSTVESAAGAQAKADQAQAAAESAAAAYTDGKDATAAHKAANLSDLADEAAARSNLGLGTAATHAATDFDAAGAAGAAQAVAHTYTDAEMNRAQAAEAANATTITSEAATARAAEAAKVHYGERAIYVTDPAYAADRTGVADSMAAFAAAETAAEAANLPVVVPHGTYKLIDPNNGAVNNVSIMLTMKVPWHFEDATIVPVIDPTRTDNVAVLAMGANNCPMTGSVTFDGTTLAASSTLAKNRFCIWRIGTVGSYLAKCSVEKASFVNLSQINLALKFSWFGIVTCYAMYCHADDLSSSNISGSATLAASTLFCHERRGDHVDTGQMSVQRQVDNHYYILADLTMTGDQLGDRNYGGSINVMGDFTANTFQQAVVGRPGDTWGQIHNVYIEGVHSYSHAFSINSASYMVVVGLSFNSVTCNLCMSLGLRASGGQTNGGSNQNIIDDVIAVAVGNAVRTVNAVIGLDGLTVTEASIAAKDNGAGAAGTGIAGGTTMTTIPAQLGQGTLSHAATPGPVALTITDLNAKTLLNFGGVSTAGGLQRTVVDATIALDGITVTEPSLTQQDSGATVTGAATGTITVTAPGTGTLSTPAAPGSSLTITITQAAAFAASSGLMVSNLRGVSPDSLNYFSQIIQVLGSNSGLSNLKFRGIRGFGAPTYPSTVSNIGLVEFAGTVTNVTMHDHDLAWMQPSGGPASPTALMDGVYIDSTASDVDVSQGKIGGFYNNIETIAGAADLRNLFWNEFPTVVNKNVQLNGNVESGEVVQSRTSVVFTNSFSSSTMGNSAFQLITLNVAGAQVGDGCAVAYGSNWPSGWALLFAGFLATGVATFLIFNKSGATGAITNASVTIKVLVPS